MQVYQNNSEIMQMNQLSCTNAEIITPTHTTVLQEFLHSLGYKDLELQVSEFAEMMNVGIESDMMESNASHPECSKLFILCITCMSQSSSKHKTESLCRPKHFTGAYGHSVDVDTVHGN